MNGETTHGLLKFDSELEMYLYGLQLTLSMAKLSLSILLRVDSRNFITHCFSPPSVMRERYRTKALALDRKTVFCGALYQSVSVVEIKYSLKHTKSDLLNIRHLKDKFQSDTKLKWSLTVTNI